MWRPVEGLRKSLLGRGPEVKSNMFSSEPAFSSKDSSPIRPRPQLSPMKRSNRCLVRYLVIDEVGPCPRRNDEQWQAGAVPTASLKSFRLRNSTTPWARECVGRGVGLADNWRHHVIIPTIGIVIGDDHSQIMPLRKTL